MPVGNNLKTAIRNCTFAYRCDQKWEELKETEQATVRFCDACKQEVFFCDTNDQLADAIKHNLCVAICIEPSIRKPIILLGLPAIDRKNAPKGKGWV